MIISLILATFMAICLQSPEQFRGVPLRDASQSPPESNRQMAAKLQRIRRAVNPFSSTFLNREQIPMLDRQIQMTSELAQKGPLLLRLASAQMNIGENARSIQTMEEVERIVSQLGGSNDPKFPRFIRVMKGVNWLRIGELENCVTNHTVLSCLAPIEAGGFHQLERGSRNALAEFRSVLLEDPHDRRARWLYNIAAMTLGEWPGDIPTAWLIPPSVFESDYDIKRFGDIAGKLALDANDLAGGAVADDFDNDGNLDVLASGWGLDSPLRFYRNRGDGTFVERGEAAGLKGLSGALNMVQADYDNDGFVDILLLRGGWLGLAGHYPSSLLRNNRDGTFTDVTEAAGLLRYRPTQTAAWLDYNNDGWIDLFIGNESWEGDPNPCELFRNNGDGTFTDVAKDVGLDVVGIVKGVTAGDFNNDRRPDLYLSLRPGANMLFRNDGPVAAAGDKWKFTNVAAEAGVTDPLFSFPTWFFDFDNDGWEDIFVAGYGINNVGDVAGDYLGKVTHGAKARIFRNNRNGTFTNVTEETNLDKVLLAMGCNFGDLDNDGWLDFYLGTGDPDLATVIPNRMFRNDGGKRFQDVTTSGGFGHLQKGHGVSFADLDNDGDEDVFVVMGGAYETDVYRRALFENPGHGNNWVKLKLEGVKSNRAAIGAKIKATFAENGQTRAVHKTVNSGGSFGANPLRQHLGLGQAKTIRQLDVFWPATGKTQSFSNLAANATWHIKESQSAITAVPLKPIAWKTSGEARHHHHAH
jgi:hypothetical protein